MTAAPIPWRGVGMGVRALHRLAAASSANGATLADRAEIGSQLLNALGGITTVERDARGRALRIKGCGCPLSVAVGQREEVCVAVQTLLRDVVGAPVREECDRTGRPQCHFVVGGT